jgi:hypothetical protein
VSAVSSYTDGQEAVLALILSQHKVVPQAGMATEEKTYALSSETKCDD